MLAAGRSLSCLAITHQHGCRWDARACAAAAGAGKLDCLQYLHQHDCAWDASTLTAAVAQGRLQCLEYAYLQGCPLDLTALAGVKRTARTRSCLDLVWTHADCDTEEKD